MSTILHEAVIQALKSAHRAYFDGCLGEYGEQLEAARAGIEAIRSLGGPMDGSTGRPVEVLTLRGEYTLVAALLMLDKPLRLVEQYEYADLALVSLLKSQVIGPKLAWLPAPRSLLEFYGGDAETLPALDRAALLYGRLTGGGGGGVTQLYRAELALRDGQRGEAARWARSAVEHMTGDRWVAPRAQELLKQIYEEEIV